MADEFPVDFDSPVGRVRKYIPDLVQLANPADPEDEPSFLFSDEEIESFLSDETNEGEYPVTSWRVRRAAAWAMIALANNENLILKKITVEDQQTDGPSVARELRSSAQVLFDLAAKDEAAAGSVEGFIHVPYREPDAYDSRYYRAPFWRVV